MAGYKITSYHVGRADERLQLWRQVDDLPYYVRLSVLDDVLWSVLMQERVIREENSGGSVHYLVWEQDGEVTRWQRNEQGQYVSRVMLTGPQWQQHVSNNPIQHRHSWYMTDEQLQEYPLLWMNVQSMRKI